MLFSLPFFHFVIRARVPMQGFHLFTDYTILLIAWYNDITTRFTNPIHISSIIYLLQNYMNQMVVGCSDNLMLSTRQARCIRQVKNVTNFVKNDRIVEFHDHIWNHHSKYIQINTNIPVVLVH